MSIWCDIAVSDVHFLIGQVVDDCLEVTAGEAWEDVGYSQFCTDLSVVFLQQLCEAFSKAWAKPVHSPIDSILDCWVPSVIDRKWFGIVDDVDDGMSVLESPKVACLTITDTKYKIAGPPSLFHASNSVI